MAEGRRSRSRSPIPQIDPLRDLSPPKWTRRADDDDDDEAATAAAAAAEAAAEQPPPPPPGGPLVMGPGGGQLAPCGAMVPMPLGAAMPVAAMHPMGACGGCGGCAMGMPMGMPMGMGVPVGMGVPMGVPAAVPAAMPMAVPMGMPMGMGMHAGATMGTLMGMDPAMCGMAAQMPTMGVPMGGMGMMGGMVPGQMGVMGMHMGAAPGQMQAMMTAQQQELRQQDHAKAVAAIKAGAVPSAADEEISTGGAPGVSRSNINHPAYRPPNTEPVPGVTDKRWEGYIRLFIEDHLHGYGFIKCAELRKRFPDKDVFLHRNQRNGFKQGDTVNFGVFMNFRGMPQATDLRRPRPKTEQDNDDN